MDMIEYWASQCDKPKKLVKEGFDVDIEALYNHGQEEVGFVYQTPGGDVDIAMNGDLDTIARLLEYIQAGMKAAHAGPSESFYQDR